MNPIDESQYRQQKSNVVFFIPYEKIEKNTVFEKIER